MMSCTNPGIGADGKLTQEEQERHCLKGLCYYCSLTINLPALTVGIPNTPNLLWLVTPPSLAQVNLR